MKNNHFNQKVNRKNTHSVKWDLIKPLNYPENTIALWVADMDFKVDPMIIEALQQKIDHAIFGYHLPIKEYQQSVCHWLFTRHQADLSKATMISTHGVVNGIAMCIETLTNPNDAVLILEPVYHPFKELIIKNNRKASIQNLKLEQGQYGIDYKQLEETIIRDDVKMMIFCSPHNPVGKVWSKQELISIMDICMKYDVLVISDEIHMDFVYPTNTHHVLVSLNKKYQDYVITLVSASKTFNLADTKIAELFVYQQQYASKITQFIERLGLSSVSGLSQVAQQAAYTYGSDYVDELLKVIANNKQIVESMLKQANSKIKIIEPQGLYLLWLDFRAYKKDPEAIMDQLLYKANVWLNNGSMFGESGQGFFRMNLASTPDLIQEATHRIIQAFDY